jgi:hypothetical protein
MAALVCAAAEQLEVGCAFVWALAAQHLDADWIAALVGGPLGAVWTSALVWAVAAAVEHLDAALVGAAELLGGVAAELLGGVAVEQQLGAFGTGVLV